MGKAKTNHVTYLTIEDIATAVDVQEDDVAVPEWGGTVRVRGFTKGQEMDLRKRAKSGPDPTDLDPELLEMLFLVDGMIDPQTTDADVAMLKDKSGAVVNRILRRIMDLSGISETIREKTEQAFREGSEPTVSVPSGT